MLYATVNNGSITTEFDRLSRAGAAGRMALIEAGAKVLGAMDSSATRSGWRVLCGLRQLIVRLRYEPMPHDGRPAPPTRPLKRRLSVEQKIVRQGGAARRWG
jgi:hypothetical protein